MTHSNGEETVDLQEAARLLEVTEDRVRAMVEEDLLSPLEGPSGATFRRYEVLALRQLGG